MGSFDQHMIYNITCLNFSRMHQKKLPVHSTTANRGDIFRRKILALVKSRISSDAKYWLVGTLISIIISFYCAELENIFREGTS